MTEELFKRLSKEAPDEKILALLSDVKGLVAKARGTIGKNHGAWDRNRDTYLGIRPLDKEDLEARDRGEPEKMILPMTYGQVNTFIAFTYLLYTQNRNYFTLNPTGTEDYSGRFAAELTLDRDLRRNSYPSRLYQQLQDMTTLGIGITKEYWVREMVTVPVSSPPTGASHGLNASSDTLQMVEKCKYEGNVIENVSPWRWFYDTRVPLSEWRRGQFCGDESSRHESELIDWERSKIVAGTKYIATMEKGKLDNRKGTRLPDFVEHVGAQGHSKSMCILTEVQIKLNPKKYDLGTESTPTLFIVWIANDDRIIRIDRMGYMHQEFTYNVAQFSPDNHCALSRSLSDVLFNLQDVVTWLINSRIISVRRNIEGRIVADPECIDASSLENDLSPVVWLRKGAPKLGGVSQFFAQIPYTDVTAAHLTDAQLLMQLSQSVTGVNENSMGQFHGGRRSATEARAVNAGAAGRMKLTATVAWWDSQAPLGAKLLTNQRQGMSEETFRKIVGSSTLELSAAWAAFHPLDPSELIGSEDFFVFDSTLETEKGFIAQSLQEILIALMSNPLNVQIFGLDPKALLDEIMELRGVGKISRFTLPAPQPVPGNVIPGPTGGEQVPQQLPPGAGAPPLQA